MNYEGVNFDCYCPEGHKFKKCEGFKRGNCYMC